MLYILFEKKYLKIVDGIEKANSISLSPYKWLYQPKDSVIVLFKDIEKANEIMNFVEIILVVRILE